MKLKLLDIPHVDDLPSPTPPVQFYVGKRGTRWAEDENGRTWIEAREFCGTNMRWVPCITVKWKTAE